MASKFDQLSLLNKSRNNWTIKVRITRMWPTISNTDDNEVLKGYNLILLDDNNSHMHAFVYPDNWNSIVDEMEEGALYLISNFYTKESTGRLKPVSSKMCINFSNSTIVQKIFEDDYMIPMHKFEFIDLGDLFDIASRYEEKSNPEFAVDIIGVVEDFEKLKLINTRYGERHILRFRITDGRYSQKVSVWGKLAIQTDTMMKTDPQRPVIAIVTSTKLTTFRTSVQISTLPSTKLYINLENDVVTSMRDRLEHEGYRVAQPVGDNSEHLGDIPVIPTLTLKELTHKKTTDDIKKIVLCNVIISKVESSQNWWYNSCNSCENEVFKLDGKFKCVTCSRNLPFAEKRLKIMVLAEDSTEALNIVLLDRAAKRIIGKTATALQVELLKNPSSSIPSSIKEIAGKQVTLYILIGEDNVLVDSIIYSATDVSDVDTTTSSNSDSSIPSCPSLNINSIVENSDYMLTPDSARSVSKKLKIG